MLQTIALVWDLCNIKRTYRLMAAFVHVNFAKHIDAIVRFSFVSTIETNVHEWERERE